MSKETEINLSVAVKDGPKTLPQKTKLPQPYIGTRVCKAANEEIELTPTSPSLSVSLPATTMGTDWIEFVTIHADRYTFKDSCGVEQPGISYHATGAATPLEILDGPHVYLHRKLQPLAFRSLQFNVCQEMFDCLKDEEKSVAINVTYGIGVSNGKKKPLCCKPAPSTPTPAQKGKRPAQKSEQSSDEREPAGV